MNQQAIPLYITQPIYHDVCIGPVTETVDGRTFKLLSESFDWGSLSPLGAVVKIDVEGSEWAALDMLDPTIFETKVVLLDLEIHWCLPRHGLDGTAQRKSILDRLHRLNRHFYVVDRFADFKKGYEGDGFSAAGCDREGQYEMMSISYVNKALFHRKN